jgi:riboflavin synthase
MRRGSKMASPCQLVISRGVFTGLVTAIGRLEAREPLASGQLLSFSHPYPPLTLGESVAVSGTCLTIIADAPFSNAEQRLFSVELSEETLRLTGLGELALGARVNLERALTAHERLGGHFVTGHVDGLGRVSERRELGSDMTEFALRLPKSLGRYVAQKGSITVAGVSLTVNSVTDLETETEFRLVVIPHTKSHTTLGELVPGKRVAIEVDLLARYIERLESSRD